MFLEGKYQSTRVFVAPPELAERGARLFRRHGPRMEATRHRTENTALLSDSVSSAPGLPDPENPETEPNGKACRILTGVDETEAGVAGPMEKAQARWKVLPEVLEWTTTRRVSGTPTARIVRSHW